MVKSFHNNKKGILLMLASSFCVCIGQILWKLSASHGILFLAAGFCLYGAGALAMVVAYRFGQLSVLQPMLSLNYVFSLALAALVLGEQVTWQKAVGVLVIIVGVLFIAGGDGE